MKKDISSSVTSNQQVDILCQMCKIKYKEKNLNSIPKENQTTFSKKWQANRWLIISNSRQRILENCFQNAGEKSLSS